MKLGSRPNFIVFVAGSLLVSFDAFAGEVNLPVIDDMTLSLGSYVQKVKVRAKSQGPGFCAVEFELAGEKISLSAPPFVWSAWADVGPAFLSASTEKLGYEIICNTGAIAEVKFYK